MTAHPILILQMQRMGDLVLCFPLFNQLRRQYPGHPLWVVGEEQFFTPLMPLSPSAAYTTYANRTGLQQKHFSLVINLSHRPEAAELAGSLRCDELIGPYRRNGAHHIRGHWQLYRASIAHNNHYNRYHWSDLNALDCVSLATIAKTPWPPITSQPATNHRGNGLQGNNHQGSGFRETSHRGTSQTTPGPRRVGLFLGASEQNKRPDATFWAGLTRYLLQRDLHPVLLGGKAEEPLGREVAKAIGSHALNLCGRFNVKELYLFIRQLDALVSPDTGPMHIATWAGTRVVNLSMGNVSPWETGPMSPGHFVVRGNVPCLDCWQCTRKEVVCKQLFKPGHVGRCVEALLASPDSPAIPDSVTGLHILRSLRPHGLHELEPLPFAGSRTFMDSEETQAHEALARFWKSWFAQALFSMNNAYAPDPPCAPFSGHHAAPSLDAATGERQTCLGSAKACSTALEELSRAHPAQATILSEEGRRLLFALSQAIKMDSNPFVEDLDFWKRFAEPLLPLTGFLQLLVQNAPSAKTGFHAALELCEKFLALVTEQDNLP